MQNPPDNNPSPTPKTPQGNNVGKRKRQEKLALALRRNLQRRKRPANTSTTD